MELFKQPPSRRARPPRPGTGGRIGQVRWRRGSGVRQTWARELTVPGRRRALVTIETSAMRVLGRGGGGPRSGVVDRGAFASPSVANSSAESTAPRTSSRSERLGWRLSIVGGNMCS